MDFSQLQGPEAVAVVSALLALVTSIGTGIFSLITKRTDTNSALAMSDREQNVKMVAKLDEDREELQDKYDAVIARLEVVISENGRLRAREAVAEIQKDQWQREREQWQKEREFWQKEREKWEQERITYKSKEIAWERERSELLGEIRILKDKLEEVMNNGKDFSGHQG